MTVTLRILTLSLGLISAGITQANDFHWPQGQKAAVSLSYDDTLNSQLDNAIPTLNNYGVRGSFYLMVASPVLAGRIDEWRAAAQAGHELGNHTIYHACSRSKPGNDWVKPYNDMDKRVVEQMHDEIVVTNSVLHAIDGKTERTFTPPCGDVETSNGNYIPAVRDLFVAIKGDDEQLPDNFATVALPNGQSGDELIAYVQQAAQQHQLINIIFHGIGGDHLAVSSEAHEALVKYLADNQDTYWSDTYLTIMTHAKGQLGL
ncbi:polysaccharide deacetylase family protein [uncultured Gilvimarinus sp.]|uniref:polysaccharide deacetylase family protein n=1 Tax=uncultured Gilvimarinus sp. TaxID=1689143 RepID=UPI0030EF83D7